MKINIVYLLLIALLGITVSASIAQQNQNVPKTDTEVEKLKIQLQTVKNEKMEIETKLIEANAKLMNADFGKFERELRDSNHKWLIGWIVFFLTVLAVVGTPLWLLLKYGINKIIENLKSNADQLIADEVEKSLKGFEEAVGKVNILETQLRILNKEQAASVLENYKYYPPEGYPEQIKELQEQAILDVFSDETRHLQFRCKAAEVLANMKSTGLVSPILKCLNSYIDSDFDWEQNYRTQHLLCDLVHFIGYVRTTETYETLKRFLEQLLSEKPEVKRYILTSITFSLVYVSSELNTKDSVPVIRNAIPILDIYSENENALKDLVEYFAKFQEHEGIKEILTNGLTEGIPDLEKQCLDLLKERHSNFVRDWKAQKEDTNTESEESDESKPTN